MPHQDINLFASVNNCGKRIDVSVSRQIILTEMRTNSKTKYYSAVARVYRYRQRIWTVIKPGKRDSNHNENLHELRKRKKNDPTVRLPKKSLAASCSDAGAAQCLRVNASIYDFRPLLEACSDPHLHTSVAQMILASPSLNVQTALDWCTFWPPLFKDGVHLYYCATTLSNPCREAWVFGNWDSTRRQSSIILIAPRDFSIIANIVR